MKNTATRRKVSLTAFVYIMIVAGTLVLADSCKKSKPVSNGTTTVADQGVKTPTTQNKTLTQSLTVAQIRKSGDGNSTKVMFNQNAELFSVTDATLITKLQSAFESHSTIAVTFDPWQGKVISIGAAKQSTETKSSAKGAAFNISLATMSNDEVNNIGASAIINTTYDSLTSVIPDIATAQLMFDFITHQACSLPGPYGIDQCISFQYCEDGCYARAHKMCWIINNKYHYATHKIFSFANAGSDQLCVQAQKWGGCCVNWWYHVAPIVNVKTPSGTKAYVFDAAMFDQPVPLATWLHAQENPACVPSGDVPHVSMINIQPTESYWPADGTGYAFATDPLYTSTNSTMVSYSSLITCP